MHHKLLETIMSTQISANISPETRELLERYVTTHGVKKSHLIETAVLHHLKALDEIPADLFIPPRNRSLAT